MNDQTQAALNERRSQEIAQRSQVQEWTPDLSTFALRRPLLDKGEGLMLRAEADRLFASYVAGLKKPKCYLIGSLRNEFVPTLAARLRRTCPDTEIFDDWYAAGPEADDYWKSYEQGRKRRYQDALEGYAAKHVFEFDKHHLDTSTHAVLVLPAGKSGHMELMYATYGAGAKTAILLEQGEDPRWDVMYQFIPNVFETIEEVEAWLGSPLTPATEA